MLERLAKLLALANRPGSRAEGDTARDRARRLARREGLAIVETHDGELLALDAFHGDLHERLMEISTSKRAPRGELGPAS